MIAVKVKEMNRTTVGLGEGKRLSTGFFVDTQEHCFFCLNGISSTVSRTCSLQYLSRYLKLNLGKVLSEEMQLSPEVVAKLTRGKLRARLCGDCASQNDKFSKLFEQLERTRMEVEQSVSGIHGKMIESVESGKAEDLQSHMIAENLLDQILTLQVAEALRNQAIQKCSEKMDCRQPRVLVRKLKLNKTSLNHTEDLPLPQSSSLGLDSGEIDDAEGAYMTSHSDDDDSPHSDELESHVRHSKFNDHPPNPCVVKLEEEETETNDVNGMEQATGESSSPPKSVHGQSYIFNTTTGTYQCTLCRGVFSTKPNWTTHYKSVHQKLRHKCPLCEKDLNSRSCLITHHKRVHLGMKFRCRSCKKVSTWHMDIISHQRESGGTCRSSKGGIEVFVSSEKERTVTIEGTTNVKCGICHLQVDNLSTHVFAAHLNVKWEVEEDELSVESPPTTRLPTPLKVSGEHYTVNSITKKYQCKLCLKPFRTLTNVSNHYQSIHQKIRHQCPQCGKEFNQLSGLDRHQKSVHLGRRFRCRTCGKVSTWHSNIDSHQREFGGTCRSGKGEIEIIMGSGNYNEGNVTPVGNTPGTKKQHLHPLPPPRPKNKNFGRGQLSKHYIFDEATGRCRCKICSKVSTSRSTWYAHYHTYHQKIRHKCNLCGRTFSQACTLMLHKVSEHLGKRFQCQACSKTFKYSTTLSNHYQTSQECRKRRSELSSPSPTSTSTSIKAEKDSN